MRGEISSREVECEDEACVLLFGQEMSLMSRRDPLSVTAWRPLRLVQVRRAEWNFSGDMRLLACLRFEAAARA